MLNPFIFPPKAITTIQARNDVQGWYAADVKTAIALLPPLQERLDAVRAVLIQLHPELEENLDALIASAELVGQMIANREASETLARQFTAALPYAIRKG